MAFTAVYASTCIALRARLWEYLNFVVGCHQVPWLLVGDFNKIHFVDDKLGGVP